MLPGVEGSGPLGAIQALPATVPLPEISAEVDAMVHGWTLTATVLMTAMIVSAKAARAQGEAPPKCTPCVTKDGTSVADGEAKTSSAACPARPAEEPVLLAIGPNAFDFGLWDATKAKKLAGGVLKGISGLFTTRVAYAAGGCPDPGSCGTIPGLDRLCPDDYTCPPPEGGWTCCPLCSCMDVQYIYYKWDGNPPEERELTPCSDAGCTGCTETCYRHKYRYTFVPDVLTRKTCAAETGYRIFFFYNEQQQECLDCSACNGWQNCSNCHDVASGCQGVLPYVGYQLLRPTVVCAAPTECCHTDPNPP